MTTDSRRVKFIRRTKLVLADLNMKIFIPYVVLMVVGLLMIYSAGSYEAIAAGLPANYYLSRQLMFSGVGFSIMIFLLYMKIEIFRKKFWLGALIFFVTALLILVLVIGEVINGAQGWLNIGGISIQPIEFAKPVVILMLADYLSRQQNSIKTYGFWRTLLSGRAQIGKNGIWREVIIKNVIPFFCLLWLAIPLLLPDVGGFALLSSLMLFMVLSSGIQPKWLKYLIGLMMVFYVGGKGILRLVDLSAWADKNYQISRLTAFVDPFADALDSGLQLVNSYYALANGGLFGLGIGQSIQKTGFLPEAETDFIMAIVGEEFGFFILTGIIALYFFLVFYLYYRAQKMHSSYLQFILIGVATYFFSQATINLGGVLGLLPITGITFPFMSYGGSSIVTTSIMTGLALSALRHDYRIKRNEIVVKADFAKQRK